MDIKNEDVEILNKVLKIEQRKLKNKNYPYFENKIFVGKPMYVLRFQSTMAVVVNKNAYFVPKSNSFHGFLICYLYIVLGRGWILSQSKKKDKHIIVKWINDIVPMLANTTFINDIAQLAGNYKSLMNFGYDLYTLAHTENIESSALIKRLKKQSKNNLFDQFQGARYELLVASIFARIGFKIKWINPSERKSPEFIATHRFSNEKVCVETKSKVRPGVLDRIGNVVSEAQLRLKVWNLYCEAVDQLAHSNFPNIIFIDLNWPATTEYEYYFNKIFTNLKSELLEKIKQAHPNINMIIFTNYSSHYYKNESCPAKGTYIIFINTNATHTFRNQLTYELIRLGCEQYENVPVWINPNEVE